MRTHANVLLSVTPEERRATAVSCLGNNQCDDNIAYDGTCNFDSKWTQFTNAITLYFERILTSKLSNVTLAY